MASTDPSRRASEASSSEMSLVDPSVVAKLLPKKDSVVGKLKIKKPAQKPKADKDDDNPPSPESPLINDIDPDLRATFPTGRPMDDKPDLIQCKHCRKPMPKTVAASHIALCLQKKNDRAQRKKEQKEAARKAREAREKGNKDAEGDAEMEDTVTVNPRGGGDGEDSVNGDKTIKTGKKAAAGTSDKSKKRKADTEGDREPKKKKTKKEIEAAKPKIPKPKGPVDVEKQCGVLLPNGAHCARSLTCKSHAMGAKRAVPGRSLPYDMLLAAYQKKNQAKQQKAAIDANAPLPDEIDASGPVDSDEETELVMAGIARWNPQPLAQHVHVSLKRKYQTVRVKEMWAQAFGRQRGLYAAQNLGLDMGLGGAASNINDTPVNLSLNLGMNPGGGEIGERKSSLVQQGGIGAGSASGGNVVTGGPVRKASMSSLGNAAASSN